jgi:proline dehydrogenase
MPHTALFEDTAIAFGMKSDRELQRAGFCSRSCHIRPGRAAGAYKSGAAAAFAYQLGRQAHYLQTLCGGETIEACEPYVRRLEQYGVKAILDYSVEGSEDGRHARMVLEEVLRSFQHAALMRMYPLLCLNPPRLHPRPCWKRSPGQNIERKEVHIKQQLKTTLTPYARRLPRCTLLS